MFVAVLFVALAISCEPGAPPLPVASAEPQTLESGALSPPYRVVTNIRHTMEWILDPAADVIWDSAGFVITAEGERDLQPTTAQGWAEVRNSAAVLAEAGNLLMMPGRSSGEDWIAYAEALTEAGVVSMAAADARDAAALFEAGGQLYQACRNCHTQFMVPLQEARKSQ